MVDPGEDLRLPASSDPSGGTPLLFANLIDSVGSEGYIMLEFSAAYPLIGEPLTPPRVNIERIERQRVARVFVPTSSFNAWISNLLANNPELGSVNG